MGFFSSANSKAENAANKLDRKLGLTDNIGSVWGTKKQRDNAMTRDEQRKFNEAEEKAGRGGKCGWW